MVYDVKQFRPILYVVVLTAITGFAMAAESQPLWALATTVLAINGFLVFRGRFKPIPRLLANVISLVAAIYPALQIRGKVGSPIIAVGEFLVVLVLIKMWEQRTNRDFASALLLSLLLMVAAAISTASLLFGVLFISFLFLALYCCLLFHLKNETDDARSMMGFTAAEAAPAAVPTALDESALRQNEKHLARSMRRLTGMVGLYAVVCAVAVFLLFPRGTGAGILGQIQWKSKDTLTGFRPEVGYEEVGKIAQNSEPVATVKVIHDGQVLQAAGPLYLRGLTHNYYNGSDTSVMRSAYLWGQRPFEGPGWKDSKQDGDIFRSSEAMSDRNREADSSPFKTHYEIEVDLFPTGTDALFTIAGATALRYEDTSGSMRRLSVHWFSHDGTVAANEPLTQEIHYQAMSTGNLGRQPSVSPHSSNIDPQILAMARRPEVSGAGLYEKRAAEIAGRSGRGIFGPTKYDREMAANIAVYLRTKYKYSLDSTGLVTTGGKDPIVAFLYDVKRGYCQYFAGAMTLMCQSLGMDARLVVGFKCDDYNDYGHYYNVRQSDAHTWVEVLTSDGWESYDPTSGNEDNSADQKTTWQRAKHFFDYLEYTWQNSVISYDSENRENLISSMDTTLNQAAVKGAGRFGGVTDLVTATGDWLASRVVGPLVALLATAIVGLVGWFVFERLKLRKRARRIGVDTLPPGDQVKLLRQLGFYDDLLRILERNQIVRPPHLTPLEFSRNMTFVPGEVYDTVGRLTRLYYKIRYGKAEINDAMQRRLVRVVSRLGEQMNPAQAYE